MLDKGESGWVMSGTKISCLKIFRFLGFVICILLIISTVEGKVQKFSLEYSHHKEALVRRTKAYDHVENRQDPFRPIITRPSTSIAPSAPHSEIRAILPTPKRKRPNWKLLGVAFGQQGREAVIQISSGERMFVRPGLVIPRSGWKVKAISEKDVLLEFFPSTSSEAEPAQSRTVILSFSVLGQS